MAKEFDKACDKHGKPVRGLWIRKGVYYGQLRVTNSTTGKRRPQKFKLLNVTTVPQAIQRLAELKAKEKRGELRGGGGVPTFGDFLDHYLRHASKSEKSMSNERSFLRGWERYFGADMKIDRITESAIREHLTRLREEINPRTHQILSPHSRNLRLYALRSMLRLAHEENQIPTFPFKGIKKEKHVAEVKEIPDAKEIESYVSTALVKCPQSGKQFGDYLRLLMYTGARKTEALSLQWADINFAKQQIHFHRNTKFSKFRYLDFNPKLELHLKDMYQRRKPGGDWLFPSPRPNLQGGRITSFRTTLEKVRENVGVYLSDHYLRHYFASQLVMAGVDRIVLAKWLGHSDGGKLIALTYGHLSNEYEKTQAQKINNL